MLVIKINNKIAGQIEDYLKANEIVFTRNGTEFEIQTAEPVGFILGRYYQQTLTNYNNEQQIQEKENAGKDIGGLKS